MMRLAVRSLIDTAALIDALKGGRVGSVELDVYEEEGDYFFEDFSSTTIEDDKQRACYLAIGTKEAIGNIEAFAGGKNLDKENCVKKEKGRCF